MSSLRRTTAGKSEISLEKLPPPQRAEILNQILSAEVEPVRVTGTYMLGIVLATIVMILLPLIYLAMVGALGWGLVYHFTHTGGLLGPSTHRGTGDGWAGIFFFTFPVVGTLLLLFMLKPLFSRPYQVSPPRSLTRKQEPLLFMFVEGLCDAVGAPRPSAIRVNSDVNASASLTHGLWGIFGNDLTLTIGLPLMAGLSLRQFGGVLAHEFGHFAQGAGMRLSLVVRLISHWFTRVVYERDRWDERLERWSRSIDIRIGWLLYLTRLMIGGTRRILWCLMMIGHGVSGYMLRQMEYDADRYETRFSGSKTFVTTSRRLAVLSVAYQNSLSALSSFYEEDRLVDNFPRLVSHNASQFKPEELKRIREHLDSREPQWYDTHPTDPQRIENALNERAEGICRVHAPASVLSTDFDRLGRVVSIDFYKESLGDKFDRSILRPFEEMAARQAEETEAFDALHRCLQGHYSFFGYRETEIPIPEVSEVSVDMITRKLAGLQKKILHLSKVYSAMLNKLHEADGHLLETFQADSMLKAKLTFKSDTFSNDLTAHHQIEDCRIDFKGRERTLRKSMQEYDQAVQTYVELGVRSLGHPEIGPKVERSVEWIEELDRLNEVRQHLNRRLGAVHQLRYAYAAMTVIWTAIEHNPDYAPLFEEGMRLMKVMSDHMKSIRSSLIDVGYPFDHARGKINLGRFLLDQLPDEENPGEIYGAAERLLDRFFRLQARILGRKCVMGESVIAAIGLNPLPEPANPADAAEQTEDEVSPIMN